MKKSEFIRAIADKTGFTQKDTREVLNAVQEVTYENLKNGEDVTVMDGLTLTRAFRDEHTARNPRTGEKFTASIDSMGLIPKSRLYVHLSSDQQTAKKVGARHGKPIIYQVDAESMSRDGYEFFLSPNGVWLTKAVPPQYLRKQA